MHANHVLDPIHILLILGCMVHQDYQVLVLPIYSNTSVLLSMHKWIPVLAHIFS
jgi:hypothetical protein